MSFCRPNDIGRAASLDTVRSVSAVMRHVGITFYEPSQRWLVEAPAASPYAPGQWLVNAEKWLADEPTITAYPNVIESAMPDWNQSYRVSVDGFSGRFVVLSMSLPCALQFTGDVGVAMKSDLSAGDALSVGDTVLRDGAALLIDSDGAANENDQLLSPPPVLRMAAISIGRRLMKLLIDEDADWDDGPQHLTDGWENDLARYA